MGVQSPPFCREMPARPSGQIPGGAEANLEQVASALQAMLGSGVEVLRR